MKKGLILYVTQFGQGAGKNAECGMLNAEWKYIGTETGNSEPVSQDKEEVLVEEAAELIELSRSLGVTAVCVAISGEDVASGWSRLVAGGVRQVLFMTVNYDSELQKFRSRGIPVRLCG
ncbi:MAG: hypothetical protein AB2L11_11380 [Syntrophobacteraceae bacterium]